MMQNEPRLPGAGIMLWIIQLVRLLLCFCQNRLNYSFSSVEKKRKAVVLMGPVIQIVSKIT